ncbi:MAG: phospho-N-acetylmuramoyl-pentapeptide-transferase [Desulfotomaculum sp.]|nr:phospho-N-acetylmuramoyl-pentapeptide-transferase [Desulfotomaculum sp.]MCL0080722.1 phospho-N-acetylmuramoyl-pentapeptide-transferase [Peptococcaceae bacterium]
MNDIYIYLNIAFGLVFLITVIVGLILIPVLKKIKFGQNIRDDGPVSHFKKTGTPTMGGIIFLIGIAVVSFSLLGAGLSLSGIQDGLVVLVVLLGFGLIGFLDDFIKIGLKRSLGLKVREKLLGQIIVALGLGITAVMILGRGTDIVIPFSGFLIENGWRYDLGLVGFLIFTILVVVGASNAVNLTDGLDGLAAGNVLIAAVPFIIIALITAKEGIALVLAAVVGGCLGFLIFNRYPAKVFMGDTGSLALGGALGAAAVLTRSEIFLLIIGGIFVLETLSVIIQVISFKITGKRIFRMSPLHHHFELSGWSENRVVITFWLVGILFGVLGLLGLYGL